MSFHRNHWLLFGTIFFGFIGLAVVIAIGPAYWSQMKVRSGASGEPLSDLEQRGLEVYVAEGCVACHTQQVRPIPTDEAWGRPSAPRDYGNLGGLMDFWRPYTPAVLGSSRIGPDLSNVASRQPSRTWHYLHLYNPRSVVDASIMPAYPWLFETRKSPGEEARAVPVPERFASGSGKVVPTERGKALVAYLLSLEQRRRSESSRWPGGGEPSEEDQGTQQKTAAVPSPADGASLYGTHCASCHQTDGSGVAGTFPPLAGDPIVTADDPREHIGTILNGAQGRTIDGKTYAAAMPPLGRSLSDEQIAAIVNHERSSWENDAPPVTPEEVARVRSGGR